MPITLSALLFSSLFSFAQLNPSVAPTAKEFAPSVRLGKLETRRSLQLLIEKNNGLPNIVLIGYWTPTNEMLREFSPHVEQNPNGWIGENWEGRGYNIYAFFPEFPSGLGIGAGDFQVDYQSTAESFWAIVPALEPRAILSFGRAQANQDWEIEQVTRNLTTWVDDYLLPFSPTPAPPDPTLAADQPRLSQFPGNEIVAALKRSGLSLNPFVDASGAGDFLCEFLGLHLSWYRESNPNLVAFATHTHIGSASRLADLKQGVKVTLRTLIANFPPSNPPGRGISERLMKSKPLRR